MNALVLIDLVEKAAQLLSRRRVMIIVRQIDLDVS
jgi:hypothetical protein